MDTLTLFGIAFVVVPVAGVLVGRICSLSSKQWDATLPKDRRGIGGLGKESEASIG